MRSFKVYQPDSDMVMVLFTNFVWCVGDHFRGCDFLSYVDGSRGRVWTNIFFIHKSPHEEID